MADLVEETVRTIRARMSELAPVVAEYERLQAAYAALEGRGADSGDGRSARAGAQRRRQKPVRARGNSVSRPSRPRAPRGQNKAAVFGVIASRPGVTVSEIAQVTGIAKPLIYNTTRAGVERGELDRVALPGGQQGFRAREAASASASAAAPS